MRIDFDDLRKAKPENIERLARWLGVETHPVKRGHHFTQFLYKVLGAIKHLERLPRGTLPKSER